MSAAIAHGPSKYPSSYDDTHDRRPTDHSELSQLSTFSLAGHETSSVALTWILYYMCLNPEVQTKLRAEIFEIQDAMEAQGRTVLSPDDLAKMPYMDAVVVRYFPP